MFIELRQIRIIMDQWVPLGLPAVTGLGHGSRNKLFWKKGEKS